MKERRLRAVTVLILAAATAAFAVLAGLVVRVPGDDISLREALATATLPEHIRYCYEHYSGRVTAKALEYAGAHASLPLWRSLETAAYAVLAASLYGIAGECRRAGMPEGEEDAVSAPLRMLAACAVPFLMYFRTFDESSLWISGTTNYSFIAVPGVTGALLFARHFFRGAAKTWQKAAAALLLAFSLCGNEQTGAVITAFLMIAAAARLISRKKDAYTWGMAAGAVLLFILCYVVCPGTKGRFELEMNARIPEFMSMSLARHANIAARWTAWSMTKGMGFLPGLLWLALALLLWSDRKKGGARACLAAVLAAGAGVHFLSFVFPVLEEFMVGWYRTDYTVLSYAMMAFFALEWVACLAGTWLVFETAGQKVFAVLLILAGAASVMMMTVSPSMIDSGERTKYVGALLFGVLYLWLTVRLCGRSSGKRLLAAAGMTAFAAVCALANWAALFAGIHRGFTAFIP